MLYPDDFPTKQYILNAKLDSYKKHLDQAIDAINEALSLDLQWYVAWSGGKDSTALAHLCNQIKPNIPIWSCRDNADFPNLHEYIKSLAFQFEFNLDFCDTNIDAFEFLKRNKVDICEDMNTKGTLVADKLFFDFVKIQESKLGGVFMGLRNDESKGRLWNYKTKGDLYQRKDGFWVCNPLSNWSATDIFSYLIANEIPIFDVYFKTKFVKKPEDIRMDWSLPGNFANSGYCVWLKYYYPELFAKYASIFPEMRNYT
jgi:3'-phosphoadenosine 5'-phosphosulfate sulfotransferase (PAPS reductase)/FAD synthetase